MTTSDKLKLLLCLLGVTVGGVSIFMPAPGVTKAQLVDAGIGECPPVDAICPQRLDDGGYVRTRVKARDCRAIGLGFVLPPAKNGEWFRVDRCRRADTDTLPNEDSQATEQHECACRMAAGACSVRLSDGGTGPAPFGVTFGPGYAFEQFGGAGCQRKSCGVYAGESDWPASCPEAAP